MSSVPEGGRVPYVDLGAHNARFKSDYLAAFERVVDSGWLILGPEVEALEAELAELLGAKEVVGVNSGTDALCLALRLRGIGAGDEVITVSHSFVATATAISLVGATPVFIDVDPRSMLMDPSQLASALSAKTKAVMPVHLNGQPAAREEILRFCAANELDLIEDCAQAIGVRAQGQRVGSSPGSLGCFSLHPLKVLSALGDAGFISLHDADEATQLRRLRNLGLANRNECTSVSVNSRLDALQAALLRVKLQAYPELVATRRQHAAAYRDALRGLVELPPEDVQGDHSIYSAFVIRHPRRDALCEAMLARGVDVKVHYPLAIHQQGVYASQGGAAHRCVGELPVTQQVVNEILSLPVSAELSVPQRARVIDTLLDCLKLPELRA